MSHDPEAATVGGLLLVNDLWWKLVGVVSAEDFTDPMAHRIFAMVGERVRAGEPADPVTLGEIAGDAVYSAAHVMARDCYSPASTLSYAAIVRERAERRRLRKAGESIALANTYDEAQAILATVRPAQARAIKTATDGLREMAEALQRRYDADGSVSGVPTGMASLDALTSGWQPGNLIVVAARPGMGKSVFALQAALAAGRTFYGSLEMTAGELIERAVSHVGQLPHRWIRFPLDAPDYAGAQVTAAAKKVAALPLLIDDTPALTADAMFSRVRQSHMVDPLSLAVFDHLGLFSRPGKHDPSELGQITSGAKQLAKELNIPVVVLCQLNRGLESRTDKRPVMADLRDSGRIEEDADVVIGLYRDEYYHPQGSLAGYIEAIVLKNRSGERGTAWARSLLSRMTLESCDEPIRPAGTTGANVASGGFQARGRPRREPTAVSGACVRD